MSSIAEIKIRRMLSLFILYKPPASFAGGFISWAKPVETEADLRSREKRINRPQPMAEFEVLELVDVLPSSHPAGMLRDARLQRAGNTWR